MLLFLLDCLGLGQEGVENFCSTWNDFGAGGAGLPGSTRLVPRGTNPWKRLEQSPNLVVEPEQNDDRHDDGAEEYLYDVIVEDLLIGV
jgi:hypothetical protein